MQMPCLHPSKGFDIYKPRHAISKSIQEITFSDISSWLYGKFSLLNQTSPYLQVMARYPIWHTEILIDHFLLIRFQTHFYIDLKKNVVLFPNSKFLNSQRKATIKKIRYLYLLMDHSFTWKNLGCYQLAFARGSSFENLFFSYNTSNPHLCHGSNLESMGGVVIEGAGPMLPSTAKLSDLVPISNDSPSWPIPEVS